MKIETFLDSYGVRNMCIAHDYCTCIARINPATVRHWVNSAMKQIIDLLRPITPFL